jgi:hypothetical protein
MLKVYTDDVTIVFDPLVLATVAISARALHPNT